MKIGSPISVLLLEGGRGWGRGLAEEADECVHGEGFLEPAEGLELIDAPLRDRRGRDDYYAHA